MRVRSRSSFRAFAGAIFHLGVFAAAPVATAESIGEFLVPLGTTWRYLADGTNQGTAWRATGFADGGWPQGAAELGYGDGAEATVVNCGPSAPACTSNNFITTYFRTSFPVNDAGSIAGLELKLLRDDGAVVYINGTQVASSNMPGAPGYTTLASSAVSGSGETTLFPFTVSPGVLVDGTNVIAVEVHQSGATSSDVSFNASLQVTSGASISLVRSPYLQNVTPTSAIVRWRTTGVGTTRVRWALSPAEITSPCNLPSCNQVDVAGTRTEHIVSLAGLPTETKIYYAVGTTTHTLAGGDAHHFLRVSPHAGQRRPIRIWVTGDHGKCASSAQGCIDVAAVRTGYATYAGSDLADLWLMMGDNAYESGTDTEFTNGHFVPFATIMRNTPFWAVPGNHEFLGGADSPTQTGAYYDSHSFPTAGEAGGVPSATEAYYSFDYGNVHFLMLDSHDTSRAAPANPGINICPAGGGGAGAMYQWACADLQATEQDFIVAVWHHPPYSKGSHDSDSESRLVEMRERFLPVMERYGVDLVLAGHSHSYERSVLLDEHYGLSNTYSAALHAVDPGDGDPNGDGAYSKSLIGPWGNTGTVAAVPGNSSETVGGPLNHPVMVTSLDTLGSMVIDVVGRQLDARMIGVSGNVLDHFQLVKGAPLPVCSDGIDQDGDGDFDFPSDAGCASANGTVENPQCDDGLDNDGDTLIDFPGDPGCVSTADDDEFAVFPACSDGLDNDGDTLVDFPGDAGCADAMSSLEDPQCNDGIDNDGDTLVDLADPDCASAPDDVESPPPPVCSDGLDNDGDGLVDFPADPGCKTALIAIENPKCDDDLDDDGDGKIDWDGGAAAVTPDPQCTNGWKNREAASACGFGAELALALPLLAAFRRHRRSSRRSSDAVQRPRSRRW